MAGADPVKELVVRDLTVSFRAVQALRGVHLAVAPGEVVVLAGPNGSGKTTLLRAVAGLTLVAGGRVTYGGVDITAWPAWRRARLGLVYAPERARVAAGMSVYDNLAVGARGDAAALREGLGEVFRLFPCLAAKRQQKAGLLSGGERQMVLIGRALMARPGCLLLDEPFSGLSGAAKDLLVALLQKMRARQVAVLISEHDLPCIGRVADRVCALTDGRVAFAGTAGEFQDPGVLEGLYA